MTTCSTIILSSTIITFLNSEWIYTIYTLEIGVLNDFSIKLTTTIAQSLTEDHMWKMFKNRLLWHHWTIWKETWLENSLYCSLQIIYFSEIKYPPPMHRNKLTGSNWKMLRYLLLELIYWTQTVYKIIIDNIPIHCNEMRDTSYSNFG